MKLVRKFLLAAFAVMFMSACASNNAPQYAELPMAGKSLSAQGTSNSDVIAPQDLLEIEVFKVPDLTKSVRVEDNGKITLPLIGAIQASGKSASQLEKTIAQHLAKDYMHNPQVSVFVRESTRNRVTVSGAVNRPGVFPIAGDTTLTQVIAQAEGLSRLAVKETVTVFRNKQPHTVRLEEINQGKKSDPVVMAGDKIHVHTSETYDKLDRYGRFIAPFGFLR